jgi:hypothetical protein
VIQENQATQSTLSSEDPPRRELERCRPQIQTTLSNLQTEQALAQDLGERHTRALATK